MADFFLKILMADWSTYIKEYAKYISIDYGFVYYRMTQFP